MRSNTFIDEIFIFFRSGAIIHKNYLYGSASLLPVSTFFMVMIYTCEMDFLSALLLVLSVNDEAISFLIIRFYRFPTSHFFGYYIVHIPIGVPGRFVLKFSFK